jgi:4-amino-4-deoxy-L-arabinose transferase-like glycosyltransferase
MRRMFLYCDEHVGACLWLPFWVLMATIAMFQHGPMPMFSTRALSVAWEMWQRHSFLVPYLNGAPYSDKAPLLFWLIQIGWAAFGVGDVWPRLLEVGFGAVELILLAALARRLFPDSRWHRYAAPWLLLTFTYGFLFGLQVMYEVLLAVCVLGALLSLQPSARREQPRFVLFALAIGLGLLTKGPVMLLHVVFPWLLGPWWNAWAQRERGRWYGQGALALLAGGAMLVVWALLAAQAGGAAYRDQLLFHQTAGRVVHAFAHAKPLWWYVPLLPVLIFPFALWPRAWLALSTLRGPLDRGMRFLIAWLAPVFVAFSLVSGKQLYYLLPEYAGFALLLASVLWRQHRRYADHPERSAYRAWLGPWPLALLNLAAGFALLLLPLGIRTGHVHSSMLIALAPLSAYFGVAYLLVGCALFLRGRGELVRIAVVGAIAAVLANGLFSAALWPAFNLQPAADMLSRAQARGLPIANLESYDGQFHFLGRLTQPIQPLHTAAELQDWVAAHPNGLVIGYPNAMTPAMIRQAAYAQPFRGVWMAVWSVPELTSAHADRWLPAAYQSPSAAENLVR